MNITILRHEYIPGKRTLGSLYPTPDDPLMPINPDGLPPVCYTMEPEHDITRAKVSGSDTAIPAGEYLFGVEAHPKYRLPVMRVKDVPGRFGILVHPGSKDAHTLGCPMPGTAIVDSPDGRVVVASQAAMEKLLLLVTGEKTIEDVRAGIKAGRTYPGILTIKDKAET